MTFRFRDRDKNKCKVAIAPQEKIRSEPPSGHYAVTNVYVNPVTGKLEYEKNGTPEE